MKSKYLMVQTTASRSSRKSTYATLLLTFHEGDGSNAESVVEALLTYWLSWSILLNVLEYVLNQYVFPLTI